MLKKATICFLIFIVLISGCTSKLPEKMGSIQVNSTPSGAEIYFDNAYQGTTPNTINNVATGSHTIELRYRDYQNWFTTIGFTGNSASVSGSLLPILQPTLTPTSFPVQTTALPLSTTEPEKNTTDPIIGRWVRQYFSTGS